LKFESLEPKLLLAADFGDAPAPYPTVLANNGASHTATGAILGALRDTEANGTPSAAADGDGADEDGVQIGLLHAGESGASIVVTVSGIPQGSAQRLDGWIDFDGDGNWGGPLERVFTGAQVYAGQNTLTVSVPSWAVIGTTYARFRLSSTGVTAPTGAAANGEVEDYAVTIAPPLAGPLQFSETSVSASAGVSSVVAADMDGDGDQDLVTGDASGGGVNWYENNGLGSFTKHAVRVLSGTAVGPVTVLAADFTGDGVLDILASPSSGANAKVFYKLPDSSYSSLSIATGLATGAADIDANGSLNVLLADPAAGSFSWQLPGTFSPPKTIGTGAAGVSHVVAADIDRDGDLDAVGASEGDNTIAWYENNGSQVFTRHVVASDASGVFQSLVLDFDHDGDVDVLGASAGTGEITWYENDGAESFTRHSVQIMPGVNRIAAADVDGDGDLDVLATSNAAAPVLLVNDGSQQFAVQSLPSTMVGATSMVAVDVDGDRVLDLAVAGGDGLTILHQDAPLDFGDAPAPYPTVFAENGARHYPVGPRLGGGRDGGLDGGHTVDASGDGADDDGVTFGALQVGDAGASVTVNVQNAPTGARLDAWIDFNRDGSWSGADEHFVANAAVVEGDNVITFAVPSDAVAGETFARFRLSTAGGLGVGGAALDGEIEDYRLAIAPPARSSGVFGAPQVLTSNLQNGALVVSADLDGDGDVDLITTDGGGYVYWYENSGTGNFVSHRASDTGSGTIDYLDVVDVDNDGALDVVTKAGSYLWWYRNTGATTFARTAIAYANTATQPQLVDFDADGDVDLLLASSWNSSEGIYVLTNDGLGTFTKHTLVSVPQNFVSAVDADGDGDLDIFAAQLSWGTTRLYVNDGQNHFTSTNLPAATPGWGIHSLAPVDLDSDGDLDLMVTVGQPSEVTLPRQIAWYDNVGGTYTLRTIGEYSNGVRQVEASDVDGDGDLDVVASSDWFEEVAWFENIGNTRFTARPAIAKSQIYPTNRPIGFALADLDGDGDFDLASTDEYSRKLSWQAQEFFAVGDYGDAPTPYPVTPSADGAFHEAVGPTLGALRDVDAPPDNSAGAVWDGADDDGVAITPIRIGQLGATFTVNVQNAPAGAKLDAWIDFDGDGDWSRAEEHVAAGMAVSEGDNVLKFDVPGSALAGTTFARFRVSTAGNLGYRGAAADGEVEDYAVTIEAPLAASGPFFEAHTVAADAASGRFVASVDLDRDGDMDAVVSTLGGLFWYENLGGSVFQPHGIPAATSTFSLAVGDFDLDGDVDLAFAGEQYWLENDGLQQFSPHSSITSYNTPGPIRWVLADVDGDGDHDLLSESSALINNGQQVFVGPFFSGVPFNFGPTYAVDVDRDGDLDILQQGSSSRIAYLENLNGRFSERSIASNATVTPGVLSAADMDGDGDLDLLSAANVSGNNVRWYENDGHDYFTERLVGSFGGGTPWQLLRGDVDGDGDIDVVASSPSGTSWYENDGEQAFTRHDVLAHGGPAALADMDGDGRLDVVIASPSLFAGAQSHGLAWYSLADRQVSVAMGPVSTVTEESGDEVVVTFSRDGHLDEELTVPFALSGGASLGDDYELSGAATVTATGGTVFFPANVLSVEVHIKPLDDAIKELDEAVQVEILPMPGVGVFRAGVVAKITSNELAGDYNDDAVVDGADFLAWQRGVGGTSEPAGSGADGDLDGTVDADDLNQVWRVDFGRAAAPAAEIAAARLLAQNEAALEATMAAAFAEYQATSSPNASGSLSRPGYRPSIKGR
jgi:hypothetical protein